MRLKHLTLQGYKSFGARTEFEFSEAITAIVGPNGSGKSNVADAIRWALGEQSLLTLRGKSTADMIFAGGRVRARAGMAEVSLTLDNADGWLPVAFSEVVLSRRAYRSGENEYFVNGSRVRRRDLAELLAESGLGQRHYVVVGQGLVDAALSLRPAERRALFEDAAGIGLYRSRRELALQRLSEAGRNLERVGDIVGEIAPRLHRLEAEARREEERQRVTAHLTRLQRTWYGYQWGRRQAALDPAKQRASAMAADMPAKQERLSSVIEQLAGARTRDGELRARLRDWRRLDAGLRERAAALGRELAVAQERARSTNAQQEDLLDERNQLVAQGEAQRAQASRISDDIEALERDFSNCTRVVTELDQQWLAIRAIADRAVERNSDAERDLRRQRVRLAELDGAMHDSLAEAARLAEERAASAETAQRLVARRGSIAEEMDRLVRAISLQTEKVAVARLRVDGQEQETHRLTAQQMDCERQVEATLAQVELPPPEVVRLEDSLRRQREELAQIEQELTGAEEEAARLAGEEQALARMLLGRAAHGLAISAIEAAGVSGIHGPMSALIRVPVEWERAIETALGDDLDALVVERSASVEEIARVAEEAQARVTLLPLDALRRPPPLPTRALSAATVAECKDVVRPAVDALMGPLALCDSADAARSLLAEMPAGSRCVTRGGAVFTAEGALSVGQIVVDGSLSVEKARADLVRRIAAAADRGATLRQRRALLRLGAAEAQTTAEEHLRQAALARAAAGREEADRLARAQSAAAVADEALRGHREALDREVELAKQYRLQKEAMEAQMLDLDAQSSDLLARPDERRLESSRTALVAAEAVVNKPAETREAGDRAPVDGRSWSLARARDTQSKKVAALEGSVAGLVAKTAAAREEAGRFEREQLSRARTRAAVADETLRSARAALNREKAIVDRLSARESERRARIAHLEGERDRLKTRIAALEADKRKQDRQVEELRGYIEPAEAEMTLLDKELRRLEAEERLAEAEARDAEARCRQAELDAERVEDRLRLLAQRIEQDLGLVEIELADTVAAQTPLPLRPLVSNLPRVEQLPAGLEEEMQRLKARERRYRRINPNALAEYEDVRKRHKFLSEQSDDLREAAAQLRRAVVELDQVMEEAFGRTFEAVGAEFSRLFPILFGGGAAHLVLTEPEDLLNTGVDVVAHPPGKRGQRLAMLSGGERALTATSLLFALLKVSPTPFCVLDEVDATLDEANAARFRLLLDALAKQTQFIVITHNRVTVEAADTIYGVSMGTGGVSQVVSMQLD